MSYRNGAACSPDPSTAERLQCGTAGLVFFVIDYDGSKGTVSNIQAGSGTFIDQPAQGRILWIPASARAGTPGVIGPRDAGSLTYDFTYTANRADDTVTASAQGYWTDDATALGEPESPSAVAQSGLSSLGTVTATPVTLASARVEKTSEGRSVRWTTATEAANLGFNVYGEEGEGGWRRLNERLIPSRAIDSTAPLDYSFAVDDPDVVRFVIEDVALDGAGALHGPFLPGGPSAIVRRPPRSTGRRCEASSSRSAGRACARGSPDPAPRRRRGRACWSHQDRIHRVRSEDLLAAGLDFGPVPPDELALTLRRRAVPIRVEAPGGVFGPGASSSSWARVSTPSTRGSNVYTLVRDPGQHGACGSPDAPGAAGPAGPPATTTRRPAGRARPPVYSFASPGDDPWYDTRIVAFAGAGGSELDVDLDGFSAGRRVSGLDVDLWGVTSWPEEKDHHAAISWNGIAARPGGVGRSDGAAHHRCRCPRARHRRANVCCRPARRTPAFPGTSPTSRATP